MHSMTSSDAPTDTAAQSGKKPTRRPWRGLLKVVGIGAAVLALLFAGGRLSLLPSLDGLFGERTHDRSGPAVLKSIQDMSAYEAASGSGPTTGPAPRS